MTQIIGRGERAFMEILARNYKINPQIRVNTLTETEDTSERRKKETVDFVIYNTEKKNIVVRIQDKRHKSEKMSNIDYNQKIDLQNAGYIVIDIPEEECPHLFNDEVNEDSISEIRYYLKDYIQIS